MSLLSVIFAEFSQYLFPGFGTWLPGKPELVETILLVIGDTKR